MNIRAATAEDLPEIVALWKGEYDEEDVDILGKAFSWYSSFKFAEGTLLGKVPGEVFVAEVDHKIVGMNISQYMPFGGNANVIICHEIAWYVYPEYRKIGIGKALVDAVEVEAIKKGAQRISLGTAVTTPYSDILIEKYKKWGYVPFQTLCVKAIGD